MHPKKPLVASPEHSCESDCTHDAGHLKRDRNNNKSNHHNNKNKEKELKEESLEWEQLAKGLAAPAEGAHSLHTPTNTHHFCSRLLRANQNTCRTVS